MSRRGWGKVAVWLPVVAGAYLVPETFYSPTPEQRWQVALAAGVGVIVGVLWQLLNRRDLADRLLVPALLMPAYMALWVVVPHAKISLGLLFFATSLASALVVTERVLRRRDATERATSDQSALTADRIDSRAP